MAKKSAAEDFQRAQEAMALYGTLKGRIEKRERMKVSALIAGLRTMTEREIFSIIGGIAENRALLDDLEREAKIAQADVGHITA